MTEVFIDGSAGTTGLRIRERLAARKDLCLLTLPEGQRKDPAARAEMLNRAGVSFLCLPDAAAVEAASMVTSDRAVIIDTSTAHRVADGWTYGMAELPGGRKKIAASVRIANPGCHATGFISLVAPLVAAGLLRKDARLSCFSLTGYSGGGKKMIAEYEAAEPDPLYRAPRQYALGQVHKHLPEMAKVCSLEYAPVFCPVVAPYYAGMEVTVPLTPDEISATPEEIREVYREAYRTGMIRFSETADENGFLSACAFAGRDDLEVAVFGNPDRILLVSRFDNLGKRASGAAIQNMNIVLGLDEAEGLVTGSRG